jgi:4-hydroxybenzoate polyprenyltransferase
LVSRWKVELENRALEPLGRNLRLFLALSRTPHALLDLATPALSALVWLGTFPPAWTVVLGLVTAFAGYTAVYALNDLIDLKSDRERLGSGPSMGSRSDVDALFVRHPLAQGLLPLKHGLLWALGWSAVALGGALLLRPVCAGIFLAACFLEAIYCRLFQVSSLRSLVSGGVKSSGAVAAIFAVDPHPDPLFLVHLFLWLCLWEIGGQNIPNDWADLEEDLKLRGKTIPVALGKEKTAKLALGCLTLATILGAMLPITSKAPLGAVYFPASVASGTICLLFPGRMLARERTPAAAGTLFNRASYYPLGMLASVLMAI